MDLLHTLVARGPALTVQIRPCQSTQTLSLAANPPIITRGPTLVGLLVLTRRRSSLTPSVTIHNQAYQKLFPFVVTCPSSLLPLPPSRISTRHVVKLPCSEPSTVHVVKLQDSEPFRIVWYNVKLHLPGLGPDTRYGAKLQPRTSRSPRQYR
jgi:hypothetical protein